MTPRHGMGMLGCFLLKTRVAGWPRAFRSSKDLYHLLPNRVSGALPDRAVGLDHPGDPCSGSGSTHVLGVEFHERGWQDATNRHFRSGHCFTCIQEIGLRFSFNFKTQHASKFTSFRGSVGNLLWHGQISILS